MEIQYLNNSILIKSLLTIYIIGFLIGTITHTIELINGGFLPYTFVPLWKNIYWTSLTFFDFAAILLILISIKPALILSILIIVSDVLINSSNINLQQFSIIVNYRLIFQFTFGLYILITAPVIWKLAKSNSEKKRHL